MPLKITYFVHGTTTDNEASLATGWNDGELSELGKEQAIELGQMVADQHFDAVFCSDLKRALDSAELGFGYLNKIKDARLREINYGDFSGQPDQSFKNNLTVPLPMIGVEPSLGNRAGSMKLKIKNL